MAATLVALSGVAVAAPFVPRESTQVIATLTPRTGPRWDEIRRLRERLAAAPTTPGTAARLAETYLNLFRTEGDPRLIGYAAVALAPWPHDAPAPPAVAVQRIAIAQLQHRFDEAERGLAVLLEDDAGNAQAWLMRAAIALVRGRYAQSRSACARVVLTADVLTGGACLAAVQALTGQAAQAYAFLDSLAARRGSELHFELAAWVHTLAAETAVALERAGIAERQFQGALAAAARGGERPTVYLVSAYADFLLDQGRYADVLALLADAPSNDSTLLRAALARKRLGLPVARALEDLAQRLQLALSGHENTHAREAAYFLLRLRDAPRDALSRALDNWTVQREPLDARLVLEAAVALCDADAAAPVLRWLQANAVEHGALRRLRAILQGDCA